MKFPTVLRQPGAFPLAAPPFAALATVLAHVFISGVVGEAGEWTAAQVFQMLMTAGVPIMAFFAIQWPPGFPKQALRALALQAGAAGAAHAPVFILDL